VGRAGDYYLAVPVGSTLRRLDIGVVGNITGIGGFFWRAKDPKALKEWYIKQLGVDIKNMVWQQEAGPTVFEPFAHDTDYFAAEQQWMINFRVTDLQQLIAELEVKGISVETRDEWNSEEIGTFARIHDPEGNPIELWEPAGANDG